MASEGTGEREFDELAQPAAFGLVIADMAFEAIRVALMGGGRSTPPQKSQV